MTEEKAFLLEEETPIDLRKVLLKYWAYWPWFLVSLAVGVGVALIYLRYADTVYSSSATVLILDEGESDVLAAEFSELLGKSSINLENEIARFKSVRLAEQVVRRLDLNSTYMLHGDVRSSLLYDVPFRIYPTGMGEVVNGMEVDIALLEEGYSVSSADGAFSQSFRGYGDHSFSYLGMDWTLQTLDSMAINTMSLRELTVYVEPVKVAAKKLVRSLEVVPQNGESDILQIRLAGTDKVRSREIIDTLIEVFAQDDVRDQQEVSKRTIDFVDERFRYLELELDSVEEAKKDFKQENKLSLMEGDVELSLKKQESGEEELRRLETQNMLAQLLAESIQENQGNRLLPQNLGLDNAAINVLVEEYNTLFLEYEKLSSSAGVNNPVYGLTSAKLRELRSNIEVSVDRYLAQLKSGIDRLASLQQSQQAEYGRFPEKERILRNIERQQTLKESLYLLLLQKREEAAISLSVATPDIKVIDYAITDLEPIAPKRNIVLAAGVLMGLLIPFGILYVVFLWDTKIHDREAIETLDTDIPLLGEIPFLGEDRLVADARDRSPYGESFRILGSNLDYLFEKEHGPKKTKLILVTSAIKGEGKSLIAANMAVGFASLNKRVLLMGADFRNPQLHKYFSRNRDEKGILDVLVDSDASWQDYVVSAVSGYDTLDAIFAGSSSLNPSVVLASGRFDTLVASIAENYEYVIMDSAPTLLVADTLKIAKNADVTLQVLRAGVTDRKILDYWSNARKEGKLKNMAFVLNDVEKKSAYGYGYGYGYGYNYGYGYGYGESKRKVAWYRRLFSKINLF